VDSADVVRRNGHTDSGSVRTTFGADSVYDEPIPSTSRWSRWLRSARPATALIAGLVLLGPLLALLAYRARSEAHDAAAQRAIEDALAERTHEVDTELRSLSEALYALRGLFEASDGVTRAEFATFTREARARHPTIVAIGWVPRVEAADRAAHETAVRNEGFADYAVSTRAKDGTKRPVPGLQRSSDASPVHYPVVYLEPLQGNEPLLGLDLASDPGRNEALARAAATAKPAVSPPLSLLTRASGGSGAILALPLYGRRSSPAGPGDTPSGFVGLSFQFADVLRHVRGLVRAEAWTRLDVTWIDTPVPPVTPDTPATRDGSGGVAARSVIAATDGEAPPPDDSPLVARQSLTFAGRSYELVATPTRRFLAEHGDHDSLAVAGIVLVAWLLLGLLLYVLARSWRSSALAKQARLVRRVMRSLAEGVVVSDRDCHVQMANDAALALLGVSMADLRAGRWPTTTTGSNPGGPVRERIPLARAARGEVVPEEEVRFERRDGAGGPKESVHLAVSGRPLLDARNSVQGGIVVFRDVTAQRRFEESLREKDLEMRLAANVQQRLFPARPPDVPGLDVAGAVFPSVATAGDYFDYVSLPDGRLAIVVGDVAGHGLGPAIVMAETRAYFRALAAAGFPLDETVARINERLAEDLGDGLFVTLLVVAIDPATRRLSYVSAGHTPALLLDAAGAVKGRLCATGPVLGIYPDASPALVAGPAMADGDTLLLMTDGVVECPCEGRDIFDEEGVIGAVRGHLGEAADATVARVHSAADVASRGQLRRDDFTLVVCRAVGPSSARDSVVAETTGPA